jgi:hypothetical protein
LPALGVAWTFGFVCLVPIGRGHPGKGSSAPQAAFDRGRMSPDLRLSGECAQGEQAVRGR